MIAVVAMISTAALNGCFRAASRWPPRRTECCLRRSPGCTARRTPVFGLVVSSLLVTALMLMNYTKGLVDAFTFVILLATLTTLVPYAFSAVVQAYLWLVEPESFQLKHLVSDLVVATLAFAYSVWAIAGAGEDVVTKGFVLLLAGIPVYIGMKWWQRRQSVVVDVSAAETPSESLVTEGKV